MGKTRDLFNKIGDVKGTFHAKMGIINGRNHKDLTEKKIVRRRGKNKENSTRRYCGWRLKRGRILETEGIPYAKTQQEK